MIKSALQTSEILSNNKLHDVNEIIENFALINSFGSSGTSVTEGKTKVFSNH